MLDNGSIIKDFWLLTLKTIISIYTSSCCGNLISQFWVIWDTREFLMAYDTRWFSCVLIFTLSFTDAKLILVLLLMDNGTNNILFWCKTLQN